MKRKTRQQREDARMELLKAVRDGKPYSKSWNLWAPFSQAALVNIVQKEGAKYACTLSHVTLTDWGLVVLKNWEKRRAKQ